MLQNIVQQKLINQEKFNALQMELLIVRQVLVKILQVLQNKQIVIITFLDAFFLIMHVKLQRLQL